MILSGRVKTVGGQLVNVSTRQDQIYKNPSESGLETTFHLGKTGDGKYYIQVFGKNGEIKKDHVLTVSLNHSFVRKSVTVKLQTNESSVIDLGELYNITEVSVTDKHTTRRWELLGDVRGPSIPYSFCVAENTNFKFTCNTNFSDQFF